jgi:hypothetical protein
VQAPSHSHDEVRKPALAHFGEQADVVNVRALDEGLDHVPLGWLGNGASDQEELYGEYSYRPPDGAMEIANDLRARTEPEAIFPRQTTKHPSKVGMTSNISTSKRLFSLAGYLGFTCKTFKERGGKHESEAVNGLVAAIRGSLF